MASDPRARRALLGVLLGLSLVFLGLVAGTFIGGRYFVAPGSGLAGPAIALGYGVLGALVGLVLALLTAWLAPAGVLTGATRVAGACAGLAVCVVGWRFVDLQMQERGLDQPLPTTESWSLVSTLPESVSMRSYRELEIGASTWRFRYVAIGPEAATCRGRLIAQEAEGLALHAKALESRLPTLPRSCLEGDTEADSSVVFRPGPAASFAEMKATPACRRDLPDLAKLLEILRRIPIDAVSHARVECG